MGKDEKQKGKIRSAKPFFFFLAEKGTVSLIIMHAIK